MGASPVGRNDPCPCGSGKKYKKCCLAKHEAARPSVQEPAGPGAGHNAARWLSEAEAELAHLDELMHEAEHATEDGRFERAEELALMIRKQSPLTIHSAYLFGKLRAAQGRWGEAAAAYQEATKIIQADPASFDEESVREIEQGLEAARSKITS
jgi:hypothetical protein